MLNLIRGKKKIKVVSKCIFRTNIFSKGTGLMFHKKISDEAHIFVMNDERKVSITMFFMFFHIDIIFLDKNKKIVEKYESLSPWTNLYPKNKALYVIELPDKTIKKKGIKMRDKLSF